MPASIVSSFLQWENDSSIDLRSPASTLNWMQDVEGLKIWKRCLLSISMNRNKNTPILEDERRRVFQETIHCDYYPQRSNSVPAISFSSDLFCHYTFLKDRYHERLCPLNLLCLASYSNKTLGLLIYHTLVSSIFLVHPICNVNVLHVHKKEHVTDTILLHKWVKASHIKAWNVKRKSHCDSNLTELTGLIFFSRVNDHKVHFSYS